MTLQNPNYDFSESDFFEEALATLEMAPPRYEDAEMEQLHEEVEEHLVRYLVARLESGEESEEVRDVERALAFQASDYYRSLLASRELERLSMGVEAGVKLSGYLPSEIYR